MRQMQNQIDVVSNPRSTFRGSRKCSSPPRLETIFEEDETVDVYMTKGNVYFVPLFFSLFTYYFFSRCIVVS
ncbi:Protein BTN1 [Bienertia sinuspersici]